MTDKESKVKTLSFRDINLVIMLVVLMNIFFNSESLSDWFKNSPDRQSRTPEFAKFILEWHQSLDLLGFTTSRKRLKKSFQSSVTLNYGPDIGFEQQTPRPSMDMLDLASKSSYWSKLSLNISDLEFDGHHQYKEGLKLQDNEEQESLLSHKGQESILVIGDSIMGGIAPMIKRELRRRGHGTAPIINWKISSGLARSDYYNWPKVANHLVNSHKVDIVVALFGTNDPFKPIKSKNKSVSYKSKGWKQAYRTQVKLMQDILCKKARTVYWIALPPMRKPELDSETARLNSIYQDVSKESQCVQFIATKPLLANNEGSYTTYRMVGKRKQKIREGDGIHLTQHGGRLVAKYILNRINLDKELAH